MSRISKLREVFEESDIDVLVVSNASNIRYLSGFSGSSGTIVVGSEFAELITDNRYAIQARAECAAVDGAISVTIGTGSGRAEVLNVLNGAGSVGLEAEHVSWSAFRGFEKALDSELVPTSGLVETLRETKSGDEIALIGAAADIADRALAEVQPMLQGGVSERILAAELDAAMRVLGADRPAFNTIVASGPNSARPHHRPGDRRIEAGDLVIVDFGAELHGYRSDMTRTFHIGQPSDQAETLLREVGVAQAAGVDAAGPGVSVAEVDAACRSHLDAVGLGEWFTHGTGHGVGLDIHEAPWVSAKGTATLAPGHVITVEPGVYLPDVGGVRWEDTIVITSTGAESLTGFVKQPIIEP